MHVNHRRKVVHSHDRSRKTRTGQENGKPRLLVKRRASKGTGTRAVGTGVWAFRDVVEGYRCPTPVDPDNPYGPMKWAMHWNRVTRRVEVTTPVTRKLPAPRAVVYATHWPRHRQTAKRILRRAIARLA